MIIWVSKYALGAKGKISRHTVDERDDGYVSIGTAWSLYKLGRDAFLTEADALANAESRRKTKLASLRKQIKKLEALTFSAPPQPTEGSGE